MRRFCGLPGAAFTARKRRPSHLRWIGGVSPFCAMHSARSRLLYANRYFTKREFDRIYRRMVFAEPFLRFAGALIDGGGAASSFAAPLRGAKMAKEAMNAR